MINVPRISETHFCYLLKDEEKPREKEKGKTRHIDKFLEELKFEQELREKRNQEREGRHIDNSAVSSYFNHMFLRNILLLPRIFWLD